MANEERVMCMDGIRGRVISNFILGGDGGDGGGDGGGGREEEGRRRREKCMNRTKNKILNNYYHFCFQFSGWMRARVFLWYGWIIAQKLC